MEKLTDIDGLLKQYDLENISEDKIDYNQLTDTEVIVIDRRNAQERLYLHSDVTSELDENGVLTVVIADRTVNTENDISGAYAIVIHSKKKINSVVIEEK